MAIVVLPMPPGPTIVTNLCSISFSWIAALMIARVECPMLDAGPYLDQLDDIGREALRYLHAPPKDTASQFARSAATR